MVNGGGADPEEIMGRRTRGGGGLAGSGTDPKRGRRLPQHMPRVCDVEGSGDDSQLPLHQFHHLTQLPPRVLDGSQYEDRHPRDQAVPSGFRLEGGGAPCNLLGSAQGIQYPGHVQVTGHIGGIWCGDQVPPPPMQVLLAA